MKPLGPATMIARTERHGLSQPEIRELGLHTSQHFTGPKPVRRRMPRPEEPSESVGAMAMRMGKSCIGG